jgi:hypothetical protein
MPTSYDFDTEARKWEYSVQALNQQDLDRNFSLATTHIVKWWASSQPAACPQPR